MKEGDTIEVKVLERRPRRQDSPDAAASSCPFPEGEEGERAAERMAQAREAGPPPRRDGPRGDGPPRGDRPRERRDRR